MLWKQHAPGLGDPSREFRTSLRHLRQSPGLQRRPAPRTPPRCSRRPPRSAPRPAGTQSRAAPQPHRGAGPRRRRPDPGPARPGPPRPTRPLTSGCRWLSFSTAAREATNTAGWQCWVRSSASRGPSRQRESRSYPSTFSARRYMSRTPGYCCSPRHIPTNWLPCPGKSSTVPSRGQRRSRLAAAAPGSSASTELCRRSLRVAARSPAPGRELPHRRAAPRRPPRPLQPPSRHGAAAQPPMAAARERALPRERGGPRRQPLPRRAPAEGTGREGTREAALALAALSPVRRPWPGPHQTPPPALRREPAPGRGSPRGPEGGASLSEQSRRDRRQQQRGRGGGNAGVARGTGSGWDGTGSPRGGAAPQRGPSAARAPSALPRVGGAR